MLAILVFIFRRRTSTSWWASSATSGQELTEVRGANTKVVCRVKASSFQIRSGYGLPRIHELCWDSCVWYETHGYRPMCTWYYIYIHKVLVPPPPRRSLCLRRRISGGSCRRLSRPLAHLWWRQSVTDNWHRCLSPAATLFGHPLLQTPGDDEVQQNLAMKRGEHLTETLHYILYFWNTLKMWCFLFSSTEEEGFLLGCMLSVVTTSRLQPSKNQVERSPPLPPTTRTSNGQFCHPSRGWRQTMPRG